MLSVVLATFNEAHNIARCLEAVSDIADEMIVVDGESSDGTAEIARRLGARVISTTNKPNFHINKQMAMDEAQGDLILQLDADEVVDAELKSFIVDLQKNIAKIEENAWYINRKNLFLGAFLKKGGQYPDPVIRLYKKGTARLPQEDVHEQMEVDGKVGTARGHLLHYANPSFNAYLYKFNRYTSFKAQQLSDDDLKITLANTGRYCLILPIVTFLRIFIRHKGFVDGFPGFVFAAMSGFYHTIAYIKLWEMKEVEKTT